ncbi:hypothetical protein BT69DRAFT_1276294 [Atractiella rhizophila]|nr:hypothetical protein BT69DRAFT_1276294 [Atractiella rhizophila]
MPACGLDLPWMARFHPHAAKRNSDLFPDSVTGKTELQQQCRTEPGAGIYVMVWVADFANWYELEEADP